MSKLYLLFGCVLAVVGSTALLAAEGEGSEAALATMSPRAGFVVELVAHEPLTMDPVAFAWGADGKFWVVEMADYPLGVDGKGTPGGRVRYLEDVDGDGRYDKSTLFLDGIRFPTGVLPWRKGVLVTAAPEIFYAEDTDGDGHADKREVLFTGFKEGNQQHRVNGLAWGLDNWIYCANGDSGGSIKSVKTGVVTDINGRDVRIRPDTGELDLQEGKTQFGRNRDDWGNWFGCNNSNPMYQFVIPDQYTRGNPYVPAIDSRVNVSVTPGASPVFPISKTVARFNDIAAANRFTSACGVIVYRDDLFGPAFAGNAFVSEPVHNLVHREVMHPQGATFTSERASDEQQSEFLASTDNWFRPTMIRTGPDGALWVADMYRETIEHPEWIPTDWQRRLDLRAGHDKGRIYRVAPKEAKRRPIPRLDKRNVAELVASLDSPSGWQRDTAQQLLIERGDKSAIPLLQQQAVASSRPLCRLQSLCTLDGLGGLTSPTVLRALQDAHPGVRRHAIRLCEGLAERSPELIAALTKLTADEDAQVRLQLGCTIGELDDPRLGAALADLLLKNQNDRFIFAASMSAVTMQNVSSLLEAVLASREIGPAQGRLLENLLGLSAAFGQQQGFAKLLTKAATPEEGKFAAWQFSAVVGLLEALDRRKTSLASLQEKAGPEMREALAALGKMFVAARETARSEMAAPEDRAAAARLLGRGLNDPQEDLTTLTGLLTPQTTAEVQQAAVAALGRMREPRVAEVLLEAWAGFGPALRSAVLDILLSRESWHDQLLQALEQKRVNVVDIDAAHRQRLLDHKTLEVRERSGRLFAGTINSDRQKLIGQYRPAISLKSDPAHGAKVFAKTCAQCHKLGGVGHELGPDLAALTDKSPESMLVAVLDPNRAVESKFLNYTAVTKGGLTFNGLLAAETGNSITLKGPEGKQQVILRSDLDELISSTKSTMPEGLEKDLPPQDLADVIAYIRANVPLPTRKEFAGNAPEVVRPDPDGTLLLTAKSSEIYGPSLIFQPEFGNLGYWLGNDDHAAWTVEVTEPGKYGVELESSCDEKSAGNTLRLEAETGSLKTKVANTTKWENYQVANIGTINLEAGRQRITIRAEGRIRNALGDVRMIRLKRVK